MSKQAKLQNLVYREEAIYVDHFPAINPLKCGKVPFYLIYVKQNWYKQVLTPLLPSSSPPPFDFIPLPPALVISFPYHTSYPCPILGIKDNEMFPVCYTIVHVMHEIQNRWR